MSGICGIVQDDASARVDVATFDAMARAMESRGPDGSSAWTGGRAAFAHAMLRTTFEAAAESQPLTLDQRTWLAADARIDAREQLRGELSAAGLPCPPAPQIRADPARLPRVGRGLRTPPAGRLRLRDLGCARKTLARDHFGVKPFFHAARLAPSFSQTRCNPSDSHPTWPPSWTTSPSPTSCSSMR
jgi:asparagine synthase (glutamine-hydrolysing)